MQYAKRRRLNRQHEAMAQSVAAGLTIKEAFVAAGFAERSHHYDVVAKREDFQQRVAMLRQEREWGGSPDLAPAINMLMRGAEQAMALNNGAAMAAAARMVAEAARLKQKLPKTRRTGDDLSVEEWIARYGPKS